MAAPNQQPLSSSPGVAYKPYQSHRRTASARSSISTPSVGGPFIPPRPGPSSLATSAGPEVRVDASAAVNNATRSASSSALLRPSPSPATAFAPSPLTKQQDPLDAPPPLRKLQSKTSSATSASTSPSQAAAAATQGRSLARAPPPSNPKDSPLGAAAETTTARLPNTISSSSAASEVDIRRGSSSLPPSSPAAPPRTASPKANGAGARPNGERSAPSGLSNSRSQNANSVSTNLDRFNFQLPVSKSISTAQALRMRELQDHSSSGSPSMSTAGESSGGSSAHSSRAQSPVPPPAMSRNGGSSSMSGFEAMYAAQQQAQQKTSSSRLAPPFSATPRSGSFQPRGVSRSQLPDFLEAKSIKRAKKKQQRGGGLLAAQDQEREDERIRRRVEKLLAIHYSAPTENASLPIAASTSFSSSLLSTLAPHSRFLTTLQRSSNLRAAEQALVPWQPDDSINACPLCTKAFGVGRRKHHCRACGKVVCASPELAVSSNPPPGATSMLDEREGQPALKCSNIVVKDERALAAASAVGGAAGEALLAIKDLPPDVSLEALLSQSKPGQGSTAASKSVLEASQHGFRLCRECKTVVLRSHYLLEEGEAPEYIRLYDQLMVLQKEIEQSLPEFQELVMGLQKQDTSSTLGLEAAANGTSSPPSSPSSRRGSASGPTLSRAALLQLQRDAATARKQLLANFANYDALSRRIRDLPDGGNNSLKRIKDGVDRKAAAFLQMNMFPLQSLPKFDATSAASSSTAASKKGTSASGTSSPKAAGKKVLTSAEQDQLVVLQEQHTQIASFLSRAQKERKLTDVVLLKRNLEELEQEMGRLTTR